MKRDDLCPAIRQTLVRYAPPDDAHYGVIPPAPPRDGLDLRSVAGTVRAATAALATVDALAAELASPWLISRLLPRREAVTSSAMEGTNSTLDALLSAEEDDADATSDTRQVRSYALTLERVIPLARQHRDRVFTLDLVQDLHRAVMADDQDYADPPGALRERVVWVGGGKDISRSIFNPPPHDRVPACLDDHIAYLADDDLHKLHQGIIARMAVAHAHFEAIHPFRDGNGRVGRLLLPLMMAAEGHVPLYLSPYIEAHKGQYYDALKAAQQRLDWARMVGFLADAVVGTVEELKATRAALEALAGQWNLRRKFRKGSASARALPLLQEYPVLTAQRLSALLDVSFPAAATALKQLEDAGIVAERTGYKRNRIFAATDVLAILNRPFGDTPILPE